MNWETVIGLEVHVQLKTNSKLFSNSATRFGAPPNTQTNFVDAGLPGTLPVLNRKAVHMAIQFGLSIEANIQDLSYFERKNYFYPDLPKGYQISQLQRPIISNGHLDINLSSNQTKRVIIDRAHLEEDAGKSLHDAHQLYTGIDLNRAGIPLLEIVTTPCLSSAIEAIAYLKSLRQLVQFLGICDGNMQEGSFRCDVNLSLRPAGSSILGTRTELKNLNSFRFIEKAIAVEQNRHQDLLEEGLPVVQETRLYNPDTNTTHAMRSKEGETDYRYFADPDLLPIKITDDDRTQIKAHLPLLPQAIRHRLINDDQLSADDVEFLLSSPAVFYYYDKTKSKSDAAAKTIVNWLKGTYQAALNERGLDFDTSPMTTDTFAYLLNKIVDQTISVLSAKQIVVKLMTGEHDIDGLIAEKKSEQSNGHAQQLDDIIKEIIKNNPQQVSDYRAGKEKLLAFFVGLIMKQTKGCADPAEVNALLRKHLC
jgi:aspartyl-tRNA(Asn)/glutamyl-tRNA(Gln) amidotransferase subunit B